MNGKALLLLLRLRADLRSTPNYNLQSQTHVNYYTYRRVSELMLTKSRVLVNDSMIGFVCIRGKRPRREGLSRLPEQLHSTPDNRGSYVRKPSRLTAAELRLRR